MIKTFVAGVDRIATDVVATSKLPSSIASPAVYGACAAAAGAAFCALFGIGYGFGKGIVADIGTILAKSVKK